jgi:methionine--tRNA ligase beta chain
MITFEDFKKLDIRIGTVISAEKIPETDKLLKLEVDFDTEHRQIVSGIAEKYMPEDIIGKQFPFILNLEPRVIRGVESNGMIMAADDEKPVLLSPIEKVNNGAIVK